MTAANLCVKRHSLYIRYSFGRLPVIISPSRTQNASRLGDWIFSIISGDSERKCTCGTLSERPHERTEKDIPKVVSDGEINPKPKNSVYFSLPLLPTRFFRHVAKRQSIDKLTT